MLSRATVASTCKVCEMSIKDIPAVVSIENKSFSTPWSATALKNELKKAFSLCYVAKVENNIIGYAIAWRVANEMQIANLAVDPRFRRLGIAQRLINALITQAIKEQVEAVHLEVRKSSAPAIRFYEKLGFHITGERKNYYQAEGIDAWLMTKQL